MRTPRTDGFKTGERGASAGLYRLACRCNHSCNPNVRKQFRGTDGHVHVYANTTIREGAELFNSYAALTLHVRKRRELLRSKYAFDCTCERCRHELRAEGS
jgi:SET domain-containing protein